MRQYKSFETERLILKPTSEEDALFMLALLNTPKWIKNIGDRQVKSVEDAKEYIKTRIKPQLEKLGFSNYTIIRKSDKVKVGICGLYDRDGLEGLDLGYALLPEHEGNGYAFEAAKEIKRVGVEVFGISRIKAITTKDNIASQKLLEKLDFKFKRIVQLSAGEEELLLYEFRY